MTFLELKDAVFAEMLKTKANPPSYCVEVEFWSFEGMTIPNKTKRSEELSWSVSADAGRVRVSASAPEAALALFKREWWGRYPSQVQEENLEKVDADRVKIESPEKEPEP